MKCIINEARPTGCTYTTTNLAIHIETTCGTRWIDLSNDRRSSHNENRVWVPDHTVVMCSGAMTWGNRITMVNPSPLFRLKCLLLLCAF